MKTNSIGAVITRSVRRATVRLRSRLISAMHTFIRTHIVDDAPENVSLEEPKRSSLSFYERVLFVLLLALVPLFWGFTFASVADWLSQQRNTILPR